MKTIKQSDRLATLKNIEKKYGKADKNTLEKAVDRIDGKGYIALEEIIYCTDILGLSMGATAEKLGCSKSNISARLQRAGWTPGYLRKFKEHRADILAAKQGVLLTAVDESKVESANLRDIAIAYGIFADKERLERGLATEHIAYADLTNDLAEIRKKKRELLSELGEDADG